MLFSLAACSKDEDYSNPELFGNWIAVDDEANLYPSFYFGDWGGGSRTYWGVKSMISREPFDFSVTPNAITMTFEEDGHTETVYYKLINKLLHFYINGPDKEAVIYRRTNI